MPLLALISLWTRHIIDTKMWAAEDVALCDWDLDGDLDLLATAYDDADYNGCVMLYERTEAGWVEHPLFSSDFIGPYKLYPVDMDADGDTDLVVTAIVESGAGGDYLFWLENNSGDIYPTYHTIAHAAQTIAGKVPVARDLDMDGDTDIVITNFIQTEPRPGAITVFWNAGDNLTWTPETLHAALEPRALAVVDLEGDGDPDILAGALREDSLWLFVNDGGGSFTKLHLGTMPMPYYGFGPCDLDGDGDIDWAVASRDTNLDAGFWWFENQGGYAFRGHQVVGEDPGGWIEVVISGDIDGDGDADFAAGGAGANVWWYENTGAGFIPHLVDTVPYVMDGSHIGDVDGDGDLDIMGGAVEWGYVIWWENPFLGVQENPRVGQDFILFGDNLLALEPLSIYDLSGRLVARLSPGQSFGREGVYAVVGRERKVVLIKRRF